MSLKNDLVLRAAKGEYTERTPVWLMRQAGRVLPEYRATRSKAANFVAFVENPDLAAEVTIQPVDLLEVDAAILFSDILVIPQAMGLPYKMIEQKGPWFEKTIQSSADLAMLKIADPESDLGFVLESIRLTLKGLNNRVPLIGFAGAPWTIFAYMTEGSGSKTFSLAKKMLYTQPELSHQLLQMITDSTIAYLQAKIKAGVHMVQLFDSWAGVLSPEHYQTFALPYIRQIMEKVNQVPFTLFAKGAYFALASFAKLPCQTIGLDWNMDAQWARSIIGPDKTLQGNLDPCALYGSFDEIRKHTTRMLQGFGQQRHIANLGHGLYPNIDADHVRCFVDAVKNYSHF